MKKLIEELNLTIKEFAEKFEIPYNTVRQWYNGDRKAPKYVIKMLEQIINTQDKYQQMEIEQDEFKKYEKFIDELKEKYLVRQRIEIWGDNYKFVEVKKTEHGITIEYGTNLNYTNRKLFDIEDLKRVIKQTLDK